MKARNMKERYSPSSCPEGRSLVAEELFFGTNGPYSFTCSPCECIGISGASGVGKTLLLRALADLDCHRGRILLDGRISEEYPAPQWRRLVALIPAEPRWWFATVSEHLPSGFDSSAAKELVTACGFDADVLGWQVSRLSTGEKQRLAVVRALIRKPSVLLLDETGSGLDQRNGLMLEAQIKAYRRKSNASAIWVSHDREQLDRVADRVVILHSNHLEFTTTDQEQ